MISADDDFYYKKVIILKLHKHLCNTMKCGEKWRCGMTHSCAWHCLRVNGLVYPLDKWSKFPWGPQSWSGWFRERKTSCLCWESKCDLSVIQPVDWKLHWLSHHGYYTDCLTLGPAEVCVYRKYHSELQREKLEIITLTATFEVLAVVLLKIRAFWDEEPCQWASGSCCFAGSLWCNIQGWSVQEKWIAWPWI
jgi:hypothetical protein